MLGIRLSADEEDRLARHAREVGSPKSALAREWILDRLDRDSADALVARAAAVIAAHERTHERSDSGFDEWLAALNAEDGGYDWGPEGPPA